MSSFEPETSPHRIFHLPPDEWAAWTNGIAQRQKTMLTTLERGEAVVMSGRAQQQYNLTLLSGDLYLTDQRLIWESDLVDGLTLTSVIPLGLIKETKSGWDRLLQFIRNAPRGMELFAELGAKYFFVLEREAGWREAIARGIWEHPKRSP
jgi:hypothetical protein